jgi:ribosomal 30S subunit maturation factor RimM
VFDFIETRHFFELQQVKLLVTHGIKGEVRVISKTDFAEERYKPGNTLYLFAEGAAEPINSPKSSSGTLITMFLRCSTSLRLGISLNCSR